MTNIQTNTIDRMASQALERLRVSIEANANYQLMVMQKTWKYESDQRMMAVEVPGVTIAWYKSSVSITTHGPGGSAGGPLSIGGGGSFHHAGGINGHSIRSQYENQNI